MFRKLGQVGAIAALLLCMLAAAPARAATTPEQTVDIDLPGGYKIEKGTDISAALLSRLFGPTWHEIVGDEGTQEEVSAEATGSAVQKNSRGGLGMYSGLIVSILGVLNLAAMAYVAVAIIYMWGIFAVTTAHEGSKLGGSMYNSLWVPVRHACSFSLTVPVLNGLSLMQVAIVACVALSINFANNIWDASGAYIVEHAHVGIMDTAAPMLETEAYAIVPIMFANSTISMVEANADNLPNIAAVKTEGLQDYQEFWGGGGIKIGPVIPNAPSDNNQVQLYVKIDHQAGKAIMSVVPPKGMEIANFGFIEFSYPKQDCHRDKNSGKMECRMPSDAEAYNMKAKLAQVRISQTKALWEKINVMAMEYLKSESSAAPSCVFPTDSKTCAAKIESSTMNARVNEAVSEYMAAITRESEPIINKLLNSNSEASLKKALGRALDSENGASKFGWVSAGLFTYSLASLQQKIDEQLMTRITAQYPRRADKLRNGVAWWKKLFSDDTPRKYNPSQELALKNMDEFMSSEVLANERYTAAAMTETTSDVGMKNLGEFVLNRFVSNNAMIQANSDYRSAGVLSVVLNELGSYDPIVVMSSFGTRLLSVAEWAFGASIGVGMITGSVILISAMLALVVAGAIFAYVVPITPVVFWLRALMSWLYMVVEAMVAAPFWCCSHALPEGAGFAGQHAKRGYLMLLEIVIRPTLLVIGAVFAVAIIQACGWMFNVLFNSWFANITGTFIQIGITADIAFAIVVMSTMYYVSFTVFTKGVNYLPEKIIAWCGGMGGMGLRDEEHSTAAVIAAGGIANRVQSGVGGVLGAGAQGAHKGIVAAREKMAKGLNDKADANFQQKGGTTLGESAAA